MKKLNIIYNHNIFESPYKQTEVKKTGNAIKEKFGNDIEIFVSCASNHSPNPFFDDTDLIIVEHSFVMSGEEKSTMALILNKGVTKVKNTDPHERLDVLVTFRKIEEDDIYYFPKGEVK